VARVVAFRLPLAGELRGEAPYAGALDLELDVRWHWGAELMPLNGVLTLPAGGPGTLTQQWGPCAGNLRVSRGGKGWALRAELWPAFGGPPQSPGDPALVLRGLFRLKNPVRSASTFACTLRHGALRVPGELRLDVRHDFGVILRGARLCSRARSQT
jgi:hypothetical protein